MMRLKIMILPAVKTSLGNYKPVKEDNEKGYQYIVMDRQTYSDLVEENDKIPLLEKRLYIRKSENEEKNSKLQQADEIIKKLKEIAEKYKADNIKLSNCLKEERGKKIALDKIISVSRERANKDRRIPGKKNHPGYRLLYSEVYELKIYNETKEEHETFPVWKTVIQTPFFVEIEVKEYLDMFWEDKVRENYFNKTGIGEENIINEMNLKEFEEANKKPCFFKHVYKRNFISGYWEETIYHTRGVRL